MNRILIVLFIPCLVGCAGMSSGLKRQVDRLSQNLAQAEVTINRISNDIDEIALPVIAVNELAKDAPASESGAVTVILPVDLVQEFVKSAETAEKASRVADDAREYAKRARESVDAIRDAIPEDGKFDWGSLARAAAGLVAGSGLLSGGRS